ncbi:hypothetical protein CLIM01_14679 [Colletotrichum limetticola]|uniref:Major facilitator superfamily (MFS) profile domain-containing protein n=1 Tax=Colletotrichum limetticola TaxID=1209924 RepID=A0ABQ9PA05_9PEZI|nr:hypothetical protein CLIM01_14679 [Colletotrichum limetticola]
MAATHDADSKKGGPLETEHDEKSVKGEAVVSGDYSGAHEKTDPAEIALVRKLDRRIMVSLWDLDWPFCEHDANVVSSPRLSTLEEDLGLKGVEYNTAISILFVGYLLMQVPSNMFLTRTSPSIYMSTCMIGWAAISAATAGVKNYSGLVACRFFLGFVEAPFYPGALYLLSIFYTRKELATRISILYTGQVVSTGCSGLIAAATFTTLDQVKGIAGWKWLFIIEGSVTALIAVFGFFLLPDDPSVTRWLTEDERQLAVERIRRDTVGRQERGSTMDGLKQALKDPKTWLFCACQNFHISAVSFNAYFPTLVRTMGFKSTTALLLTAPPYFVSGFLGIPFAWSSGRFNERTWHITAGLSLAVVGFAMTIGTTNNAVRYAATFLYATGAYSVGSPILGWVSDTLSQTPEKKAVAYSLVNVTANLAYIYCAYLWPTSDGPRYMIGFSCMIGFAVASIICAWAMRFWLMSINKKLRESEDENAKLYAY